MVSLRTAYARSPVATVPMLTYLERRGVGGWEQRDASLRGLRHLWARTSLVRIPNAGLACKMDIYFASPFIDKASESTPLRRD